MIIDIALFVQWIAPHLPWLMGKVADITVTKTTEGGISKLGEGQTLANWGVVCEFQNQLDQAIAFWH